MVQLAHLKGEEVPFALFLLSVLSSLCPRFSIMPSIYCERLALRHLTLNSALLGLKPFLDPEPTSAPTVLPNNDLFQEFMQTYIEKVRDQALAALTAKTRDNFNRSFKPQNPNLYYGNLHIGCYYFCQQCENHFEIVSLLGYKHVYFTARFLKNCIFNCWQ